MIFLAFGSADSEGAAGVDAVMELRLASLLSDALPSDFDSPAEALDRSFSFSFLSEPFPSATEPRPSNFLNMIKEVVFSVQTAKENTFS
jgi:hypothetical protein